MVGDGMVPAWMLIVILAREFTIAGIRQVSAAEGIVIAAAMSGKIKTVLQMIAVPALLLGKAVTHPTAQPIIMLIAEVFLYASIVMTIYSGIEYIVKNKNVFKN
jgi:CDP-diacylglycerol--glycerol-3-phosphate 3-phosphatidyltransferase/cardiolipin synthase